MNAHGNQSTERLQRTLHLRRERMHHESARRDNGKPHMYDRARQRYEQTRSDLLVRAALVEVTR